MKLACATGKRKYSKAGAKKAAKFLRYEKKYKDFTPCAYPCRNCRWWHVGNSDDNHSR